MIGTKWLMSVFAFELATVNVGLTQTQGHTIADITAMPDQTIQLKLAGNAPTTFRSYFGYLPAGRLERPAKLGAAALLAADE